jgi:hypothetical protein
LIAKFSNFKIGVVGLKKLGGGTKKLGGVAEPHLAHPWLRHYFNPAKNLIRWL